MKYAEYAEYTGCLILKNPSINMEISFETIRFDAIEFYVKSYFGNVLIENMEMNVMKICFFNSVV